MAPIPFTPSPSLPGASTPSMWIYIYILIVLSSLLLTILTTWATKSLLKRYRAAAEDAKLVLPTHVDAHVPRSVFLPVWKPAVVVVGGKDGDEKAGVEVDVAHTSVDENLPEKDTPTASPTLSTTPHTSWLSRLFQFKPNPKKTLAPSETMDLPMQMPHESWESQLCFGEDGVLRVRVCDEPQGLQQPEPREQGQVEPAEQGQVEPAEQPAVQEPVEVEKEQEEEEMEMDITSAPSLDTLASFLDHYMEAYHDSFSLSLSPSFSLSLNYDAEVDTPVLLPGLRTPSLYSSNTTDEEEEDGDEGALKTPPVPVESASAGLGMWFASEVSQEYEDTDEQSTDYAYVEETIAPRKAPPTTPKPRRVVDEVDARIASVTGSPLSNYSSSSSMDEIDEIDTHIASITNYASPKSDYGSWSPEPRMDDVDVRIREVTGCGPRSPPTSPSPRQAMLFAPRMLAPLSTSPADHRQGIHLSAPSPSPSPCGRIRITFDPTSTPTRKERARWRALSPGPSGLLGM
ncbi:hypothetical protein BDW22DRAFT_207809 [Trametopsis cervina]|nr:hypothetical protein BDW22DRAFT_207809 [Trametopsis cervina]